MTWPTYKPPGGYVPKPPRGKGWGGEKKGAGKAWTKEDRPGPEAQAAGRAAAQTAREVAKAHAVAMAELLVQIATDPTTPAPTRLDAANRLIERAEGKPSQAIGGADDLGPVKHVVTWEDGT